MCPTHITQNGPIREIKGKGSVIASRTGKASSLSFGFVLWRERAWARHRLLRMTPEMLRDNQGVTFPAGWEMQESALFLRVGVFRLCI